MATRSSAFLRALFLALFAASALANTDIIRLDMGPVRGPTPPRTRVYPIGRPPPALPAGADPDIFCTDGEFLDDVFCDLRMFYGSKYWKERSAPDLYDVDLKFVYQKKEGGGVECTNHFERSNTTEDPLRLSFASFRCGEMKDVVRLTTWRMSQIEEVTVTMRKPQDYFFSCSYKFENVGRIGGEATTRNAYRLGWSIVKFHYKSFSCVSPVAIERQTTARPSGPCDSDGRRCRPREA